MWPSSIAKYRICGCLFKAISADIFGDRAGFTMIKKLFGWLESLPRNIKTATILVLDSLYYAVAFLSSVYLTDNWRIGNVVEYTALFSTLNILASVTFRNYRVVWGFFGMRDARYMLLSMLASTVVFQVLTKGNYNVQFLVILVLITFQVVCLSRIYYANWRRAFVDPEKRENVLIIGAGEAGEQLYRELKRSAVLKFNPIGFLDDFPSRRKVKIHGAPVLGTISDLRHVKNELSVSKAIVAIPSANADQIRRIHSLAQEAEVELRTLPALKNILSGKVDPFQIKEIEPEDLLGRECVEMDESIVDELLGGKVVLVTGAGGSIGSELCMQIAKFSPKALVLFEQTEFSLYQIDMKLRERFPSLEIIPKIGDVRSSQRVEKVLAEHLPNVVFHAAAYKHVPLMERNPGEAVRTNIGGTENLVRLVGKYHVERFVLVSTDKAVNPTNVMGATKRVAEITCQLYSKIYPATKYIIVRFGNVLGSSGSVIPLFKKQIASGGPVTVTHKDMVRYFMSIPEASQLVMQASAMGRGGEIYVLDMGEPVKILDLAKEMIRLSGFLPDEEIKIALTGLRPGEKLFEELLADGELTLPTNHPKLRVAKNRDAESILLESVHRLAEIDQSEQLDSIVKLLKYLVPEFAHKC